jgi:hypothetical protein
MSASKYHWIGYDQDKFLRAFEQAEAAKRGTELHAFAHEAIRLKRRMPQNSDTVNMYINDAIGYRMTPEQLLIVNEYCFGTPDAISFSEKTMKLRISDLKTGVTQTSEKQLLVYAAMFCLEYGDAMDFKAFDLTTELRIYQNNECRLYAVDAMDVVYIMDKIKTFTRVLKDREEGRLL